MDVDSGFGDLQSVSRPVDGGEGPTRQEQRQKS